MLRNDPDKDWERFGAEDPYYSVLNTEKYRRDRLDEASLIEIFLSGQNSVESILGFAESHFGPVPRRRALEFGCGVGRLLLPLGRYFDTVLGTDVSVSMLARARAHSHLAGASNIQLVLADDRLSRIEGTFDFIVSYLVLQHVPVRRGEVIIRNLLSRLNLDGVAAIHVTCYRTSSRLRHHLHVLRRNFLPLHHLANVLSGLRWNEPLMQTNCYRLERVLRIAVEEGIGDMAMWPVQFGDHAGVVLCLHRSRVMAA